MMVKILPADVSAAFVDGVGQSGWGGAGDVVAGVGWVHNVCQVLQDTAGTGIHRNYEYYLKLWPYKLMINLHMQQTPNPAAQLP